jgi:prepilin-type N-terminal cleavage/methylation domain-containing protein
MTLRTTANGFTLIEILIATALLGMVVGIIILFGANIAEYGTTLGQRLEDEREIELWLRNLVIEIRSMGPAENGAYPIDQAAAGTLTFYTDADNDDVRERVRYFRDGTTLRKGVIEPTTTQPIVYPPANEVVTDVVHHLTNAVIFEYFGEGDPATMAQLPSPPPIADIRLIRATGTVDSDPAAPPLPATLTITATIRNLRGEI